MDRHKWSGTLSIPSLELGLMILKGVNRALVSPLDQITSLEVVPNGDDICIVRTLRTAPAAHMEILRHQTRDWGSQDAKLLITNNDCMLEIQTCCFEILAVMSVSKQLLWIGFSIFPYRGS